MELVPEVYSEPVAKPSLSGDRKPGAELEENSEEAESRQNNNSRELPAGVADNLSFNGVQKQRIVELYRQIHPLFFITLIVVSLPLLTGFYLFIKKQQNVMAGHQALLSKAEVQVKELQHARAAAVPGDEVSIISDDALAETASLSVSTTGSVSSIGPVSDIPVEVISEVQPEKAASGMQVTDELSINSFSDIASLQQQLFEKNQLLELLALENYELRQSIEFAEPLVSVAAEGVNSVSGLDSDNESEIAHVAQVVSDSNIGQSLRYKESTVAPDVEGLIVSADAAYSEHDHVTAGQLYAQALQQNPNSSSANHGVARVAALSGNVSLAIDRYRHLLDLYPHDQRAFAAMLELATDSNTVEAEVIAHAAQSTDDTVPFYSILGHYFGQKARWSQAYRYFNHALTAGRSKVPVDVLFNIAISLEQMGHTIDAAEYYRRVLQAELDTTVSTTIDRQLVAERLRIIESSVESAPDTR